MKRSRVVTLPNLPTPYCVFFTREESIKRQMHLEELAIETINLKIRNSSAWWTKKLRSHLARHQAKLVALRLSL